jgi:hypothetical protein
MKNVWSLRYIKFWTLYNEAWAPIYRFLQMTVVKDHDHVYPMIMVVSSFLRAAPTWWWWTVICWFRWWSWWQGVVIPLHVLICLLNLFCHQLQLRRGRRLLGVSPLNSFPAKFNLLNFMSWMIGSSCYWAYTIYFWALTQSNYLLFIVNLWENRYNWRLVGPTS